SSTTTASTAAKIRAADSASPSGSCVRRWAGRASPSTTPSPTSSAKPPRGSGASSDPHHRNDGGRRDEGAHDEQCVVPDRGPEEGHGERGEEAHVRQRVED